MMNGRTAGPFVPGLDGVVVTETRLSMVDGEAGRLVIAGFPVEELAGRATFEEVLYLLWHDALPDAGQLARLKGDLAARRALPEATTDLLGAAAARKVSAMDALRMAAGTLGSPDGDDRDDALRVVAAFPTVVAAYRRLARGEDPVEPDPNSRMRRTTSTCSLARSRATSGRGR